MNDMPNGSHGIGNTSTHINSGCVVGCVELRDYFAACALQGYAARGFDNTMLAIAQEAYRLADAMLQARKAKP